MPMGGGDAIMRLSRPGAGKLISVLTALVGDFANNCLINYCELIALGEGYSGVHCVG